MYSKRYYLGLLAIGLAVLIYYVSKNPQVVPELKEKIAAIRSPGAVVNSKAEKFADDQVVEKIPRIRRQTFLREMRTEARNMGKIDDNSKETETRLIERAKALTPIEIELLREISMDNRASSDERFLAVFMLGYNSHPKAQKALWAVAEAPVTGNFKPDSILYHQELVLRAQSLLGLNRQLPEEQRKTEMSAYAASQRELFLSRLAYRLLREQNKANVGP